LSRLIFITQTVSTASPILQLVQASNLPFLANFFIFAVLMIYFNDDWEVGGEDEEI
jgi:hypothetical protein